MNDQHNDRSVRPEGGLQEQYYDSSARSEGGAGLKERHYEWLLRLYPADYRRRRGDEMLATLLDAADARREHPSASRRGRDRRRHRREVASLIVNGLRARLGVGGGWPAALRVAALVLVCHAVADAWSQLVRFGEHGVTFRADTDHVLAVLAGVAALLLLARGSYGFGLGLMAVAFWSAQSGLGWLVLQLHPLYYNFWQLPLAAVLIMPLFWHGPPVPRRRARWLFGVPIAVVMLPTQHAGYLDLDRHPFAFWAVGAVALTLSIVDARVAIAAAALLVAQILPLLGQSSEPWFVTTLLTDLALAVPLTVVGTLFMRGQVRL